MWKNRMTIIVLMLAAAMILLEAGAVLFSVKYIGDEGQTESSIEEMIKHSVEVPEITTNLKMMRSFKSRS